MEQNIISKSSDLNILQILLKYAPEKENIIEFRFDINDLNYYSAYHLDSNNELTKYKIARELPDEFGDFIESENKDFNLKDYIETKYNILKKIFTKIFDIQVWDLQYTHVIWEDTEDNEWNQVIIKEAEEIYYFMIDTNKEDLKIKILDYIDKEIQRLDFHYSIDKIEEAILNEFKIKWKNEVKISKETLKDIISHYETKYFKIWIDDGITIVYYDDVIELFLVKLLLSWSIENYQEIKKGLYKIKASQTLEISKESITEKKNISNELWLLWWKIIYYKDKYLFKNIENNKEYNIKEHWNYDKMMDVLIENIWEYVPYTAFNNLEIYDKSDSRDINKKITDTKDNLQKNACKNLWININGNKFITVNKWIKLLT